MKRRPITEAEYVNAVLGDLNVLWPQATHMQRLHVVTSARNTFNRLPRLGFELVTRKQ